MITDSNLKQKYLKFMPQDAPQLQPPYDSDHPQVFVGGEGSTTSRYGRWWVVAKSIVWPAGATLTRRIVTLGVIAAIVLGAGVVPLVLISSRSSSNDAPLAADRGQEGSSGFGSPNGSSSSGNEEEPDDEGDGDDGGNRSNGDGQGGSGGGNGGGANNGGSGGGGNGGDGDGGSGNGNTPPGECPPFPAFPNESCTGVPAGTSLHTEGCPEELRTASVVYDGCLFESGIVVFEDATDVTIKNSKINFSVRPLFGPQTNHPGSLRNLTLINVEVDGQGQWNNNGAGISGSDYTCIRCTIYGTGRGFNLNDNVRIEDSYVPGDFVFQSGDHKTAIGSNGGSNYEIIHNNFICDSDAGAGCSSALSLYGDFAPVENVLVEKNLFNVGPGTGSYCVYAGSVSGKPFPLATNTRFIDNRFGKLGHSTCGIFGPFTAWDGSGAGNVWSGNAWADGSGPVGP